MSCPDLDQPRKHTRQTGKIQMFSFTTPRCNHASIALTALSPIISTLRILCFFFQGKNVALTSMSWHNSPISAPHKLDQPVRSTDSQPKTVGPRIRRMQPLQRANRSQISNPESLSNDYVTLTALACACIHYAGKTRVASRVDHHCRLLSASPDAVSYDGRGLMEAK